MEETIELDGRDIGRIIGRGGCNIKEIQAGSKCRIDVPRQKDDDDINELRPVKLRGTKEQVQRAKDVINGVIMGTDPGDAFAEIDGAVLIKNVDPISLSALVKMKDEIGAAHKAKIELEARSCRIWAQTPAEGIKCKAAIEEALEDLTTVNTIAVAVPGNIINQVVNDTALRQLQDSSGMTATVSKDDSGTCIKLTGLQGVLDEAKRLIIQLSGGEGADFIALMPGLISDTFGQKRQDLDRDMWTCGSNYGVELDVQPARINFKGEKEAVSTCRAELQQLIKFYFPDNCDAISVPAASVDYIAGEEDRELMRLQTGGCTVSLDRKNASIWLCGNPKAVENTRTRIRGTLDRWEETNQCMILPSKAQAFAIIGTQGATIRNIQSQTGATVKVDTNNLTVTISGKTKEQVRQAQLYVQQALKG